ncbi:MAG: HNH endonuclease [Candidatus Brocadiales bacterium]|nr:HNH endonuclease [Candidatus Brocadiales bacterium]
MLQKKLVSKYGFFNPTPEETTESADIDPPKRVETTVYRILRDTPLARQLKELHKNRCQICGETIKLSNSKNYSEAHHIKPLGGVHRGPDVKENIIVLCPSHHVQCDYGAIELDLKKVRSIPGHRISSEFIDYHNGQIYNKMA